VEGISATFKGEDEIDGEIVGPLILWDNDKDAF